MLFVLPASSPLCRKKFRGEFSISDQLAHRIQRRNNFTFLEEENQNPKKLKQWWFFTFHKWCSPLALQKILNFLCVTSERIKLRADLILCVLKQSRIPKISFSSEFFMFGHCMPLFTQIHWLNRLRRVALLLACSMSDELLFSIRAFKPLQLNLSTKRYDWSWDVFFFLNWRSFLLNSSFAFTVLNLFW